MAPFAVAVPVGVCSAATKPPDTLVFSPYAAHVPQGASIRPATVPERP